jgi:hypothetical protein
MNQLRKKLSSSSPFFADDSSSKVNTSSAMVTSRQQNLSQPQTAVYLDVFKDHWKQMLFVFNKSLVADDDINTVKNHLGQMINLLLDELDSIHLRSLNNESKKIIKKSLRLVNRRNSHSQKENVQIEQDVEDQDKEQIQIQTQMQIEATSSNENENRLTLEFPYGQIWDYMSKNNIFETIYLWSLSYPEYLYELKYEQLRSYENLLNHMQTNEQTSLLLCAQLHEPLFALLNHCSTHNSEQIEKHMIVIINQLCVCMCKNSALLRIFIQRNRRRHATTATATASASAVSSSANAVVTGLATDAAGAAMRAANSSTIDMETNGKNVKAAADRKFFIFSLLIPYIHREGCLGNLQLFIYFFFLKLFSYLFFK